MKIAISYSPGEELAARTAEEFFRALFTDAKVKKSDRHPPFKHIYLTTKKPGNPCDLKENP